MEPLKHSSDEILNGFVAAALVVCSGSLGWAVTGMIMADRMLEVAGATGLASGVVAGGLLDMWWHKEF